MKTMSQVYKSIESYMLKNFKNKKLVEDSKISYNDKDTDVWGFASILILTKTSADGSIHYKPFFNTTSKK